MLLHVKRSLDFGALGIEIDGVVIVRIRTWVCVTAKSVQPAPAIQKSAVFFMTHSLSLYSYIHPTALTDSQAPHPSLPL